MPAPTGASRHIPAVDCDGAFQSPASAMLEQPVDELNDRGFAAPFHAVKRISSPGSTAKEQS